MSTSFGWASVAALIASCIAVCESESPVSASSPAISSISVSLSWLPSSASSGT
ncbi:MAG: hypothetical protein FWE35_01495 [Streptosporangiales bacterium]|jgi:hypothetical protein|nr:hypothetical protein [Streptosporangiales bacterium]